MKRIALVAAAVLACGGQNRDGQVAEVPVLGRWTELVKDGAAPFGERDSAKAVLFGGRLWLSNGFYRSPATLYYDLWHSKDGKGWTHVVGDRAATDKPPKDRVPYDRDSPLVVLKDGKRVLAVGQTVWQIGGKDDSKWERVAVKGDALPPGGENAHALAHVSGIYYLHTDYRAPGRRPAHRAGVYHSEDGADWKLVSPSPEFGPRNGAVSVSFRGKLWLFGGAELHPRDGKWLDPKGRKHIYSSADGTEWEAAAEAPAWTPRAWPGIAVQGGKRLWMVGGYDLGTKHNIREIWFSDDGLVWKIASMTNNIPYLHAPACYIKDDTLYVVAGKGARTSGAEKDAPQRVTSGVWSIQLPRLP